MLAGARSSRAIQKIRFVRPGDCFTSVHGGGTMDKDELIKRLAELVDDLGFDYDRLSQSGQQTFCEILVIISEITGG